jgi:hypothetical protein
MIGSIVSHVTLYLIRKPEPYSLNQKPMQCSSALLGDNMERKAQHGGCKIGYGYIAGYLSEEYQNTIGDNIAWDWCQKEAGEYGEDWGYGSRYAYWFALFKNGQLIPKTFDILAQFKRNCNGGNVLRRKLKETFQYDVFVNFTRNGCSDIHDWCQENVGEYRKEWACEGISTVCDFYHFKTADDATRFKLVWA